MYRSLVRRNITSISVALFIALFAVIQLMEPSFLYRRDGSLRTFGLGKKKKTILPNWLVAIILAILSYLFVLYYLAIPKMRF
jgi:hypothetical protein